MKTEEEYLKEGYWKCVHCNRVNERYRKRCRYCGRMTNAESKKEKRRLEKDERPKPPSKKERKERRMKKRK